MSAITNRAICAKVETVSVRSRFVGFSKSNNTGTYQVRSTILTSQLPVSRWHEQIGDPTLADGILDRLVHNPPPLEMGGVRCVKIGGSRTHRDLVVRNLLTAASASSILNVLVKC